MLPRFYAPDAQADATELVLRLEEAHHATRVLRLKPGADIAVFDGRGREWHARLTAVAKDAVRAVVIEPLVPAREPRIPVTLAQAVLKGDHMDAVVRDATMMGVSAIVPLVTERTIARVDPASGGKAHARWHRVALASAKQCRRARLPAFDHPSTVAQIVERQADGGSQLRVVLAEPSSGLRTTPPDQIPAPGSVVLAVGPEGGWSAAELRHFAEGQFTGVTLGSLTIRADAAALVAVSMLRAAWNDL